MYTQLSNIVCTDCLFPCSTLMYRTFSNFSPTYLLEHGLGHEPMARSQVQQTQPHHGRCLHEDGILHVNGTLWKQRGEEYGENTGHGKVHAATSGVRKKERETTICESSSKQEVNQYGNRSLVLNSTTKKNFGTCGNSKENLTQPDNHQPMMFPYTFFP